MFSMPLGLRFDPGSAGTGCDPRVGRPTWRSFGARSSVAGRINRTLKHTLLYRALFSASRESFSLRRGLDFDLTLVQAEHHLWFECG